MKVCASLLGFGRTMKILTFDNSTPYLSLKVQRNKIVQLEGG